MSGTDAMREQIAQDIARVAGCQVGSERTRKLVDYVLALLATDRAAGVGEVLRPAIMAEVVENGRWSLRFDFGKGDDACRSMRNAADAFRNAAASPPAPADASREVKSDSAEYDHTFYGILNGQGKFWSPLPFHDEATARARLERYAQGANASMLETHKVVPVRVVLSLAQEPRP